MCDVITDGVDRARCDARRRAGAGWPRPTRGAAWRAWGPYLAERAWGTVREDYSARRRRLGLLPARPRPVPGLPLERGRHGRALRRAGRRSASRSALWNGVDPILKERMFGLTGAEGNHGEDVKEYWWYLDRTPDPLLDALALPLPAARVPVRRPGRGERAGAASDEPEYELVDTGIFDDDRYWVVTVDYAKAAPDDLLHADHRRRTAGPTRRRCTCCRRCGSATPGRGATRRPPEADAARRRATGSSASHRDLGPLVLVGDGDAGAAVLRQRDQRASGCAARRTARRTRRTASTTTSCTARPTVNPAGVGTKARAALPCSTVPAGGSREIRLRLTRRPPAPSRPPADLGDGFDAVMARRAAPRPTRSTPR